MTAKIHRVHFPGIGEGVVHIPGGTPYETDDEEEFDVGSYLRLGNKGFVYALSAGITDCSHGVKQGVAQFQGWASIAEDALKGATEVVVDIGASEGSDGSGNVAKDYLKGGEIMLGPAGSRLTVMSRTIVGNSALTGDGGGECTIQIDSPLSTALTKDVSVTEIMASPYKGVKTDVAAYNAVMGIATCLAAAGKYLWLQVEGPCGGLISQNDVGGNDYKTQVVFRHDGVLGKHLDTDPAEETAQHAGFILARNKNNDQGLPFIMLQIAH